MLSLFTTVIAVKFKGGQLNPPPLTLTPLSIIFKKQYLSQIQSFTRERSESTKVYKSIDLNHVEFDKTPVL